LSWSETASKLPSDKGANDAEDKREGALLYRSETKMKARFDRHIARAFTVGGQAAKLTRESM
jgi:hypothetical protein